MPLDQAADARFTKAARSRLDVKIHSRRAAPGTEPGTSRTLSENHATRPSSHVMLLQAPLVGAAEVQRRLSDAPRERHLSSRL